MNKRLLFATALLAGITAGPAAAQQQPIRLILNFDGPQLGETLTELGATWEKLADAQGGPLYSIKFANGANAVATLAACTGAQPHTGCTGLRVWAQFTKPPQLTPGAVAQRVNQFNLTSIATTATYATNGDARLNMYLISDSGIAIANMRTKLAIFAQGTGNFYQALYNQ